MMILTLIGLYDHHVDVPNIYYCHICFRIIFKLSLKHVVYGFYNTYFCITVRDKLLIDCHTRHHWVHTACKSWLTGPEEKLGARGQEIGGTGPIDCGRGQGEL